MVEAYLPFFSICGLGFRIVNDVYGCMTFMSSIIICTELFWFILLDLHTHFLKRNIVLFIFLVPIYFSLPSLLHSKKIWFTGFMLNTAPGIFHELFSYFLIISVSDLQGETGKMSASDPNSAIYVTDSAKDIKNKVLVSFSYNRIFYWDFHVAKIVLCFWSFKMWKLDHISMLYLFIFINLCFVWIKQ